MLAWPLPEFWLFSGDHCLFFFFFVSQSGSPSLSCFNTSRELRHPSPPVFPRDVRPPCARFAPYRPSAIGLSFLRHCSFCPPLLRHSPCEPNSFDPFVSLTCLLQLHRSGLRPPSVCLEFSNRFPFQHAHDLSRRLCVFLTFPSLPPPPKSVLVLYPP